MCEMHGHSRVTTIGRFIRRYSFEALMQLFNILVGQMPLAGAQDLLERGCCFTERAFSAGFWSSGELLV